MITNRTLFSYGRLTKLKVDNLYSKKKHDKQLTPACKDLNSKTASDKGEKYFKSSMQFFKKYKDDVDINLLSKRDKLNSDENINLIDHEMKENVCIADGYEKSVVQNNTRKGFKFAWMSQVLFWLLWIVVHGHIMFGDILYGFKDFVSNGSEKGKKFICLARQWFHLLIHYFEYNKRFSRINLTFWSKQLGILKSIRKECHDFLRLIRLVEYFEKCLFINVLIYCLRSLSESSWSRSLHKDNRKFRFLKYGYIDTWYKTGKFYKINFKTTNVPFECQVDNEVQEN